MSDATLQALEDIRVQASEVTQRRARAEADLANAETKLKEAVTALKEEFGVSSIDEAKKLMGSMEAQLTEAVETLRARLAEYKGEA